MVDWLVSGNSTAPYKKFKTSEIKAFIFIWAFIKHNRIIITYKIA